MTRGLMWINFALLVFVMIAVSLTVTLFVFYKKTTEITIRNDTIKASIQQKDSTIKSLTEDRDRLKAMIGATPETPTADILKQKDDLMKQYAQNFTPSNQTYSKVLANLYNQIESHNYTFESSLAEIDSLTAFNNTRDSQSKSRETAVAKLDSDIAQDTKTQLQEIEEMISLLKTSNDQVSGVASSSQTKNTKAADDLDKTFKALLEEIKAKNKSNDAIREGMDQEEVAMNNTKADGKIQYVSAASQNVSINIGRADGVSAKTTFSVYEGSVTDFVNAKSKGSIEVVMVSGAHVADCRILSDSPSNPIIPGDQIYSPVWDPGYQERFAIVGKIDYDGDGSDDLQKLITLIESNGGVIDGYQIGDTQKGRLNANTSYLIIGRQPDESTSEIARSTYSNFMRDAKDFNTKTITAKELLTRMGYNPNESAVTRYEGKSTPESFRPEAYEGRNNSNGATLSPLFQEEEDRKPLQRVPMSF